MSKQLKSKELNALLHGLEAQRCRIAKSAKGFKIYCPNGHVLSMHLTLSDHRSLMNFRSVVRQQGLAWPL